ncbi:UDP-3-O-(3-hydroxymyristoyl)glucosamine N-acyltransferase [Thermomonas sp.]|uniref:UDP-3-O-(3-hydroxymyristoyl)glucosamine N-acyltransferase n=1 Tax=Thermomonas sp. TaxID=1971895 RepID=UPI00248900F6|nr:UDP-3-O-(3-hydroxymyristoyl)glucosamine N-acyltransferase [Thermomonas sp.]MDI1252103.1 UDP-3-O-(3-hydroxymyristoyl)glucosamine N-acyltransferase [Thermomonas sp.]
MNSLAEVIRLVGIEAVVPPIKNFVVSGVAALEFAGQSEVSFFYGNRYRKYLEASKAGAIIIDATNAHLVKGLAIVASNPHAAFARIAALFDVKPARTTGVHPSAVVADDAIVAATASIGPHASIGARSRIGAGTMIGPGCVIGEDCQVGEDCELVARVTLVARVRLGQRVLIHPGAVIGADGFGIAMDHGHWIKVPQLGGVRIGDDCEIGANTTIDRGALGDTVLEEDVRLDNQIQVGHNVRIGAHTAMAGCSAVAGSASIGRHCLIGGGAGVLGHLEVCDRVVITAMTLVTHSIHEPGEYSSGTPLMDNRSWRKSAARFKQLDTLARRLNAGDKE